MFNRVSDSGISFKGINVVKKVAKNRIKSNELLADSFSRTNLINNTTAKNLNGPFGHPYTGRPVSGNGSSNTSDKIDDLINQQLDKDIDPDKAENAVEIAKNVFKFIKEAVKNVLDLD